LDEIAVCAVRRVTAPDRQVAELRPLCIRAGVSAARPVGYLDREQRKRERQPDQLQAVRIDPNVSASAAGAYVAKGGDWTPAEQMTRGDLKTGRIGSRTPFQILADYYQTGDTRDRALWDEYGRVTRGLAAVRWSRRLRGAMLGPAPRLSKATTNWRPRTLKASSPR
jgi:hypothetical protein